MAFTAAPTHAPQSLAQRVYALAQKEAREARERRDLPFGGLFAPATSDAPPAAAGRPRTPGFNPGSTL